MSRVFIALVPVDTTHVKVESVEASTWYEARERARSLSRFGEPEVMSEAESAALLEAELLGSERFDEIVKSKKDKV